MRVSVLLVSGFAAVLVALAPVELHAQKKARPPGGTDTPNGSAAPGPAALSAAARADALLTEGGEHYYAGRIEHALESFQAALAIDRELGPERRNNVAYDIGWIGECYRVTEEWDKAIDHFTRAADMLIEEGDIPTAAAWTGNIGWVYMQREEYDEALPFLLRAVELSGQCDCGMIHAMWSSHLAELYGILEEYELSVTYNLEALRYATSDDMAYLAYITTNNLANMYRNLDRFDEARSSYETALSQARAFGRPDFQSQQLENLATLAQLEGRYDEATERINESIQFAERANQMVRSHRITDVSAADARDALGERIHAAATISRDAERFEEAIAYFERALTIWEELAQPAPQSTALSGIGETYSAWGRYRESLDYFERALALSTNDADTATYLNNIGSAHHHTGDLPLALDYYRRAMVIDESLGNVQDVAIERNNIGDVYEKWGRFDRAAEEYRAALDLAEDNSWDEDIVTYRSNLGQLYGAWGDTETAEEMITSARDLALQIGDQTAAATNTGVLGTIYLAAGRVAEAVEAFEVMLARARELGQREDEAIALGNLGAAYEDLQQFGRAEEYYIEATEIAAALGLGRNEAILFNNLGHLAREQGRFEDALGYYRQATETAELHEYRDLYSTFYTNTAAVLIESGRHRDALPVLTRSIAVLEELRETAPGSLRREYLSEQVHVYEWLIGVYYQLDELYAAADVLESSRARFLLEQLGGTPKGPRTVSVSRYTDNLAADEVVVSYANVGWPNPFRFVATKKGISAAELGKRGFVVAVEERFGRDIERFAARLASDEFRSGPEVVRADEADLFAGPTSYQTRLWQERFESIILYYRYLLAKPILRASEEEALEAIGRELYIMLFDGTETILRGVETITIVPDGILGLIPFEALVLPDGRYLVEEYAIRYVQSLSVDSEVRSRAARVARENGARPTLVAGGAVYESDSYAADMAHAGESAATVRGAMSELGYDRWANLPGSLAEARAIAGIVPGADLLTGDSVTEEAIRDLDQTGRLQEYGMVHFAVHGVVVPEQPELSAIVLSQAGSPASARGASGTTGPGAAESDDDGYLTAAEIAGLDLRADLVNLSACETALGKIYGGEGIVGLTQAFLVAGASGVSATLWKVSDEATLRFMTGLYRLMEDEEMGAVQAIATMKRRFIADDQYDRPLFWAPFVYYGRDTR